MIYVICGMIGAGKTTFAKEKSQNVTDYDVVMNKDRQLKETLKYYDHNVDVYHVTTFPSVKERKAFDGKEVKYIWINTTIEQCRKNIIKRNRKRDIDDLKGTLEKNVMIKGLYMSDVLVFDEIIDVFENNERW